MGAKTETRARNEDRLLGKMARSQSEVRQSVTAAVAATCLEGKNSNLVEGGAYC